MGGWAGASALRCLEGGSKFIRVVKDDCRRLQVRECQARISYGYSYGFGFWEMRCRHAPPAMGVLGRGQRSCGCGLVLLILFCYVVWQRFTICFNGCRG